MGFRGSRAVQPPELTPPWTFTSDSSSHERFKQTYQGSRTFLTAKEDCLVLAPFPLDPSRKREFECSETEELQEPGGNGSSGCEHLTARALRPVRAVPTLSGRRMGCSTQGTAPAEEMEQQGKA